MGNDENIGVVMGPREYDCEDMPGGNGPPTDAANEVEGIISAMDAKFVRWDIYRAAGGHWVLTAELQNGQTFHETNSGFVMALVAAVDWVPLPLVPRPPVRLSRDGFTPVKSGSKWRLKYHDRDAGVQCGTRREVEAFADRSVATSNFECDIWESTHGWSRDKVEGVDFRYMR